MGALSYRRKPPSALMSCPVIHAQSSETGELTTAAMSSGQPTGRSETRRADAHEVRGLAIRYRRDQG
jgi:hypothetical protein